MGRKPKSSHSGVQLTVRLPRDAYTKLRVLAVEQDISHISLAERLLSVLLNEGNNNHIAEILEKLSLVG